MAHYDRQHPFLAKIKKRELLNQTGSTKKTYHLVLDLAGSGLKYKVGDSLAILPANPPELIEELLNRLNLPKVFEVIDPRTQQKNSIHHFLSCRVDLMRTPRSLFTYVAKKMGQNVQAFAKEMDLVTFFTQYAVEKFPFQDLVPYFAPLLPRFYSIASSQAAVGEEGHLLVATFSYEKNGKVRQGIGSQFLCETAIIGKTPIPLYLQPSKDFTLPADQTAPILMVGPGTGVAPYRGFLQQRYHEGAKGENWLVFGERQRFCDYYYRSFFENLEKQQFLKINTAFSRDQETKVYVQHCLFHHAAEVWEWLEEKKAYVYICGDKHAMAKEVTETFLAIAQQEGRLSKDEAKAYIKQLRQEKRFLLDVY